MASVIQKQLIIRGFLINYYVEEGRTDSALIFLHGWRQSGAVWGPLMSELAEKGFSVYALDLPGFGKSEVPRSPFSLQDYCEIVKEFIERLNLRDVSLVGHSFGGRVAIKLAATSPLILKKLVLVDSAGMRPKRKTAKRFLAKLLKPFFLSPFTGALRIKIYQYIGAEDYIALPELRETFLKVIQEDLTPLLSSIIASALIVWGRRDKETPLDFAYTLKKNIGQARLVIFDNAGHFSFLDCHEKFLETLIAFLEE